jgi:uncharacterized membrane protein
MPYTHNRRRPLASLGLVTLALLGVEAHGQTFGLRIIQPLPGHDSTYFASVSADGSVIGYSSSGPYGGVPTQGIVERGGVLTSISTFPPGVERSWLSAVSGSGGFGAGYVPGRWGSNSQPSHFDFDNQRITPIDFPSDAYENGYSTGISHSGEVVIGWFRAWETDRRIAFRWTAQGGVVQLQQAHPGDSDVFARGVSGDGSIVVGVSQYEGEAYRKAMRWDPTGAGVRLPSLDGDFYSDTEASGISADGRVIVGASAISLFYGRVAVVWDENDQIHRLGGDLLDTAIGSRAFAVNGDGTVIGGVVSTERNIFEAMIWTEQTQGMLLSDYLALFGIDIPVGVRLINVSSLSADGRTIAGYARFNGSERTFVVHVPTPSGVVVIASGLMFVGARRRR